MGHSFIADRFGEWCASLTHQTIPDDVCNIADRALIDTVGVIAAGGCHSLVKRMAKTVGSETGPSAVVAKGFSSPQTAALVNGAAAHAYDFDDTSYTGIMHGSAVILPAILAVADEIKCNREKLITAFIVGSEIVYTLADSLTHSHYFKGWWSTGTLGLIGATAAVAKVYGLDKEKTTAAIGFAAAGACGTKAIIGTDCKAYFVGDAARRAVDFAKAAAAGLSGPLDAIESNRGFVPLLNGGILESDHISTLGQRWRLKDPGLLFKSYPVCSAAHAVIEQTVTLLTEAQCSNSQIDTVICEVPELVDISLVYDTPTNAQQAQFSLHFAVACAICHGGVRLKDLNSEYITSPEVRTLMGRVVKKVDPALSTDAIREKYPESARVTIVLKNGQRFGGFCGEAYGMPGRPLSNEDLITKFINCLCLLGHSPQSASNYSEELFLTKKKGLNRSITDIVHDIWMLPQQD